MEQELVVASSGLGRVAVTVEAIERIVGLAAAESYGVVGLAGRGLLARIVPWGIRKGIDVAQREEGLTVEVRVVVEHGLNLAEVATGVRERVLYELERMVGLPIADLEVRVDRVRGR